MKCNRCNADSRVVDSREAPHDTVRRKRECENGHRFITIAMHSDTASQAPHAKQYARRTTKRVAYLRGIEIAQTLYLGRHVIAEKYGLKIPSVYAAARRGRTSLQLQRKIK